MWRFCRLLGSESAVIQSGSFLNDCQHSTAQHAQHKPDVLPFEHASRPHAHEDGTHSPNPQHEQQQQHLDCTPVAAQHAQHDPDALLLEYSSDRLASEGIYSPDAQHAQQQQQHQQYPEGAVQQERQQGLLEHQACPECKMHGFQQAGGSEQDQAVAARLAGVPPLGLEGRQGPQQGLGREGWQTRGGLEGRGSQQDAGLEGWQTQGTLQRQETQKSSASEGRQIKEAGGLEGRQRSTKAGSALLQRKQHQLAPVLPKQQPSDMYHVQPLPASAGTAPPSIACHAIAKTSLVMPLMPISKGTVCPNCHVGIAQPSKASLQPPSMHNQAVGQLVG